MKFRSNLYMMVKGYVYFLFILIFAVIFIVYWLTGNSVFSGYAGIVVIVVSMLLLMSEVRFKLVFKNNTLMEYQGRRIVQEFELGNNKLNTKIQKDKDTKKETYLLCVTNNASKHETVIDCTSLGKKRFKKMQKYLSKDTIKKESWWRRKFNK